LIDQINLIETRYFNDKPIIKLMNGHEIIHAVKQILAELPSHVKLVAAAKTRTMEEVNAAIEAGIRILGYNYLQEAEQMYTYVGRKARWHMIGHLQRNKVKKAVSLFDMIETVDSERLALAIDRHCAEINKTMPVLIEVNSGNEPAKAGVLPEDVPGLLRKIKNLANIEIQGLMTMGPIYADPEMIRPYFRKTKELFDMLAPDYNMHYLSMGMSDSYQIAIEEGANIVRIGTRLFGARSY